MRTRTAWSPVLSLVLSPVLSLRGLVLCTRGMSFRGLALGIVGGLLLGVSPGSSPSLTFGVTRCEAQGTKDLDAGERALLEQEAKLLEQLESGGGAKPARAPSKPSSERSNVVAGAPAPVKSEPQKTSPQTIAKAGGAAEPVAERAPRAELPARAPQAELPDGSGIESFPAASRGGVVPPGARNSADARGGGTVADLRDQLDSARAEIGSLRAELDKTRSQLMVAETQVERLSAILEQRNRDRLGSLGSGGSGSRGVSREVIENKAGGPLSPEATVIVDRANLRTGPGTTNASLTTLERGTRVTIETRRGEWYRVVTPSGGRGWVSADVVAFGLDEDPQQSTRVKGYDSRIDADLLSIPVNGRRNRVR